MFNRFTDNAIKVVVSAQEEARRLGHNYVGTEQILLGLIGVSAGLAGRTLKAHGISLGPARIEVEKIIGRGSGFVAVEIPFTPRAKRVLNSACIEADKLNEVSIHTEHLLLGLLTDEPEPQGVAIKVLQAFGVLPDTIRRTLDGLMDERVKIEKPAISRNKTGFVCPSDNQQTFYEVLQVDRDAEFRAILEAYVYLVKKYHPESETGNLMEFRKIQYAWMMESGFQFSIRSRKTDSWNEKTYYQILQVDPKAETGLIAEVYRYLAQEYHPDRLNTGDKAKYELIENAWMVLSDENKRVEYDATLKPNNTEAS